MRRRGGQWVRAHSRDERGAVLVMSILLMIPLLTISALALDVGNAYQQRRKAQNAVDASALAAARDLPKVTQATDVVATVKAYATKNYGTASAAWVGCSDSGALAVHPDSANNDTCISVDSRWRKVRVKLPSSQVATG